MNKIKTACPKCGGNLNYQLHSTSIAQNRHGFIYWILIGWWLHPVLYFFATLPMIIWRIIRPNRKQKSISKTVGVCQNCGYTTK